MKSVKTSLVSCVFGLSLLMFYGAAEAGPVNVKSLVKRPWTVTYSQNFEILSDAKPNQVLVLAEQLERFRGFAVLLLGTQLRSDGDKMSILATKGKRTWKTLGLPKDYISLVQSRSGNARDYIFVNFDGFRGNSLRKGNTGRAAVLQSIAFDLFADLSFTSPLPLWYRRGFSHYLATYSEPDDVIMLGAFDTMASRLTTLFNSSGFLRRIDTRAIMTRDTFSTIGPDSELSREERVRFGATAFLLVHYFYADNERRDKLGEYLKQELNGVSEEEALQSAFGLSFDDLSKDVTA